MKTYFSWDRTTRIFHWLNLLCVLGLIILGILLLNNKTLGVSKEGKVLLKTIHAYFGYVFVFNLSWRIIWGFFGGHYSRWRNLLPFGKNYFRECGVYVRGLISRNSSFYKGHNPLAKLFVAIMFLLMISQAATGLVLAGTDLYLPPFGHEIAEWITGDDESHKKIKDLTPLNKKNVQPGLYKEMRDFRKLYITIHVYGFYTLSILILLHIAGVVTTEIREKNGIVSAMFTGEKVSDKAPVD